MVKDDVAVVEIDHIKKLSYMFSILVGKRKFYMFSILVGKRKSYMFSILVGKRKSYMMFNVLVGRDVLHAMLSVLGDIGVVTSKSVNYRHAWC